MFCCSNGNKKSCVMCKAAVIVSECFPSARARICWLAMSLDTDFLSGSENRTLVDFNHELMVLHKGKTICAGTTCPMLLSSILGHMLFTYLLVDKEKLGKLQSLIINVIWNLQLHFLNASAFFVTKTYAKLNSRLNRYVYNCIYLFLEMY